MLVFSKLCYALCDSSFAFEFPQGNQFRIHLNEVFFRCFFSRRDCRLSVIDCGQDDGGDANVLCHASLTVALNYALRVKCDAVMLPSAIIAFSNDKIHSN